MKVFAVILLVSVAILIGVDHAWAGCGCRQPAYKDQMDYVTRYMACLDDCFITQMQQIRLQIQAADQRVSDLEAQIDRLKLKIIKLEGDRTSDQEKK